MAVVIASLFFDLEVSCCSGSTPFELLYESQLHFTVYIDVCQSLKSCLASATYARLYCYIVR
jgi:hypothetical protein